MSGNFDPEWPHGHRLAGYPDSEVKIRATGLPDMGGGQTVVAEYRMNFGRKWEWGGFTADGRWFAHLGNGARSIINCEPPILHSKSWHAWCVFSIQGHRHTVREFETQESANAYATTLRIVGDFARVEYVEREVFPQ
jgi:hypothetical protein